MLTHSNESVAPHTPTLTIPNHYYFLASLTPVSLPASPTTVVGCTSYLREGEEIWVSYAAYYPAIRPLTTGLAIAFTVV